MKITSHVQPIVDLFNGEIFGFEMLARGQPPFENPSHLFAYAEEHGIAAEVELACRAAALERIASLEPELQKKHFFINISPNLLADPDQNDDLTVSSLAEYGINHNRLVLEITETTSIDDYDVFEKSIRRCSEQGFRIALDDFGSGHSGLITLIAVAPDFLKVDREIVRDIDTSPYKQHLVRSILSFSQSVGGKVIAEGLETWDELRTVARLGVRYGQGYVLARPNADARPLDRVVTAELKSIVRSSHHQHYSIDLSISHMVTVPVCIDEGTMDNATLDRLFRRNSSVTHVVVKTEDGRPSGLITREHFYSIMSGQYGYAVYSKRHADEVARRDLTAVEETADLRTVGRMAMSREYPETYDPVVVIDADGQLVGTITMQDLLFQAFDAEVRVATSANPLTGLPGNAVIGDWLDAALRHEDYGIAYFDLDRFKEYNDSYGFAAGDELITFVAGLLVEELESGNDNVRVGHIGGDDYIVVSDESLREEWIAALCERFDEEKRRFFNESDWCRGYYESTNRRGATERVPLVTLSVAVLSSENFDQPPHPGQLGIAVSALKRKVKMTNASTGRSGYLFDRRRRAE
ncbi:MAG: bifunctional diguanylate cyclase/phosphodiesterase [Spirochaetota bacterium]